MKLAMVKIRRAKPAQRGGDNNFARHAQEKKVECIIGAYGEEKEKGPLSSSDSGPYRAGDGMRTHDNLPGKLATKPCLLGGKDRLHGYITAEPIRLQAQSCDCLELRAIVVLSAVDFRSSP